MSGFFSKFKGGVEGDEFIGRRDYLNLLKSEIKKEEIEHISLYGMPHVGKTSLILELKRTTELEGTTDCGKKILFLERVVEDDVDNNSGYKTLLRLLLHSMFHSILDIGNSDFATKIKSVIRRNDNNIEPLQMTCLFGEAVKLLSENNIRTVIALDEFEKVGRQWSEEEYILFTTLLLNKDLDFLCIAISRPHISYIVSEYVRKIIPFKPILLNPFNDEDMDEYFKALLDNGGPNLNCNRSALNEVIYICGRNPFLLSMMASDLMNNNDDLSPLEMYEDRKERYQVHFMDVTQFMLEEEKKKEKSFSHIIKCFFGTSSDYKDIIGNYIDLGYIELQDPDSKYCYKSDNYKYEDEGKKEWNYITVSFAFLNYLFTEKLDNIKDLRDLITGLVYIIRDITKRELGDKYAGNWNEEILRRLFSKNRKNKNTSYVYWDSNENKWSITSYEKLDEATKSWVKEHRCEFVKVSESSIRFAVNTINEGINVVMPALDPISIKDNGEIICSYPDEFNKYFGNEFDLFKPYDKKCLLSKLTEIQEARNEISHFSRYGNVERKHNYYKKICVGLLHNIYSHYMF